MTPIRTSTLWLLTALLAGCVYEEEHFRTEADQAICAWSVDCFNYVNNEEVCEAEAEASWEPMSSDCEFMPEEARECVRGLEALPCPDSDWAEENGFGFPSVCDQVWSC